MRLLVGTSGFAYKPWKGNFYPKELPDAGMLAYYAGQFASVEINNTFYRMPSREGLEKWASETPEGFTFVFKAPQRITHQGRLKNTGDPLGLFLETTGVLGPRRGPLLFQLPPFFKKDLERLRAFLLLLPEGVRAAFEFRHVSWLDDEVYAALRARGAALCIADTDEEEGRTPFVATAGWGYLRLRRAEYDDDALASWRTRIAAQGWDTACVFFKHEDTAAGPELARRFLAG